MAEIDCNVDFDRYFKDKTFIDISSELYREYVFPIPNIQGGARVRIDEPQWLHISESGGHRLIDLAGYSHYIPPRWVHLFWQVKEGRYNFVR